jgi:DNA helicase HerA-like ATPase
MTRKLHISPDLALPIEAVTETFAILAKRNAGKTYTAGVIAEELWKAQLPFVIADPVGVWWGLKSSADGKRAGFPITILGGEHGDLPLESTAGKVVADMVADDSVSLLLDLSGFSKGEAVRFMTDFCERLYHKNRKPLHLILDEADSFAPQKPRPEGARLLGAVDDIVRRGRARGLGVTLVTQRSAVLNKDVLTQCEVLIALRTPHPNDRKPIKAWIEVHGTDEQQQQMMDSLAALATSARRGSSAPPGSTCSSASASGRRRRSTARRRRSPAR